MSRNLTHNLFYLNLKIDRPYSKALALSYVYTTFDQQNKDATIGNHGDEPDYIRKMSQ